MKKTIIFFSLSFLFVTAFGQVEQEIYKKAKIYYANHDDLETLAHLGLEVDHGIHKKNVFFISEFSESELKHVEEAGFEIEILVPDVVAAFHRANLTNQGQTRNTTCTDEGTNITTPSNFELGDMGGFLTYQELLDELDEMHELYPNLISEKANISNFLTEGTPTTPSTTPSIGGNGIKWIKISDNPDVDEDEPEMLYTAIHHAREPLSLSQLVFYMWYLLENYETDSTVQAIVNHTELYFVPVINPDGYLYNEFLQPNGGGMWRKNRHDDHGTDLNRNYDYYEDNDPNEGVWGGEGSSGNTNSEVYRGPSPFSEVETQAMKWFVEQHDFQVAFNNHTHGNYLLYPYGYTTNIFTPEHSFYQEYSALLVQENGYTNIISSDFYPAAGDSDDFMYGTIGTHNKIYAFTPEIGDAFWPPSADIIPTSKQLVHMNFTAAKSLLNTAIIDAEENSTINTLTHDATFTLQRIGINDQGNFTVSILPISDNISAVGAALSFENMSFGDSQDGLIQIMLDENTMNGESVTYEIVVNNGLFSEKWLIESTYNTSLSPVIDEDGSSMDNFSNTNWGVTASDYYSASTSITDSPQGNYSNNTSNEIQFHQVLDLTNVQDAFATFYAKWELEPDYDYVAFEVALEGSNNYEPQCGIYTIAGNSSSIQPEGKPIYNGIQNEWVKERIDLSQYIGNKIKIRFQLYADQFVQADGFYFDDFKVFTTEGEASSTPAILAEQFSIYPNPVKNQIFITTALTNYNIQLLGMDGKLLFEDNQVNGSQSYDWSQYATGIYYLRISADNTTYVQKLIKE